MMNRAIGLAAAALLFAAPALAKDYTFTAKAGENQTVEYEQGTGTVYSKLEKSEVDARYFQPFVGKRAEFIITIFNNGQDSVNIDVSNVAASYAGEPLHVYSEQELAKIIKGRAGWASFAVAVAGGLDAAAAATPTTSTSYGHVGNTFYSSNTTTYSPNYLAQAAAQDRTQRNLNQLQASRDASLDAVKSQALQLTTVKPGQPYTAKICIDRPKDLNGTPLEISVSIGDEVHKFDFDVAKD